MTTTTSARVLGAALVGLMIAGPAASQQDPPVPPPPPGQSTSKPAARPLVPLRVQVNLVRYENEKKTTSHPFTLWVNANGSPTTLSTGSRMPIPRGGTIGAATSYEYSNVGTSIQCSAASMDDGRFRVELTINDTSATPMKDPSGLPVLQSLSTQNNLLLRDGQIAQFLASTDKITGEVTRIDVTVSILK